MRLVPPITPAEFFYCLQRCIPPGGWKRRIAVANSGGPDSTALLFLLAATIRDKLGPEIDDVGLTQSYFPRQLFSIHVNHELQAASSTMEESVMRMCERTDTPSVVQTIPWGTPPFPEKPAVEVANRERVIREARYNRLFAAMGSAQTNIIAMAHHADDQVETTIMRMSQGSSSRGLAGMRPVRRLGMGLKNVDYSHFGAEGMHNWIVRPFLHIPKARLLATCEANKLDYVNDPTNFQPAITVRNFVRHTLSAKSTSLQTEQGIDIAPYVAQLRALVPNSPPHEQLRDAVRSYSMRLEEVETQVTNILSQACLPSAPSTLRLTAPGLALATTPEVRNSLIRRCLRYVSHGPWGSTWAEAGGDRETLQRIVEQLWPQRADSSSETEGAPVPERRQFTAGAGVAMIPVTILPYKKNANRYRPVKRKEELEGWILAREAHYHRQGESMSLDATDVIVEAGRRNKGTVSVLYDNRFKLTFRPLHVPKPVEEEIVLRGARVMIEPDTKWALPKVILVGKRTTPRCIGKYLWFLEGWKESWKRPVKYQSWITMEFVRSLDAL